MKRFLLIFCFFSLCFFNLYSKREANIWYFGEKLGLDFNKGFPEPLINCKMTAPEGSSVISNEYGNAVLYTNGISLWNSNNELMANNTLYGDTSATQSALIVRLSMSNRVFYVFHSNPISYHTGVFLTRCYFDPMKYGQGEIVSSNEFLFYPTTEKMTAVYQYKRDNTWVITRPWNSTAFYSYLLNYYGFQPVPVISNVGYPLQGNQENAMGVLKASPNGKWIACVSTGLSMVEVFKFNSYSGEVYSGFILPDPELVAPYGAEFSRNGRFLYISDPVIKKIKQYDLEILNRKEMVDSCYSINTGNDEVWGLQIAPDYKIYACPKFKKYLNSIDLPELKGSDCLYTPESVKFMIGNTWTKDSTLKGLPNFVQSFFSPSDCEEDEFNYYGFLTDQDLNFVGSARMEDKSIHLTDTVKNDSGAVWRKNPVTVSNGFITRFTFRISEGDNNNDSYETSLPGGDGFAFVIQNSNPYAIGHSGAGLGYTGIPNSLAVEFDLYKNSARNTPDVNDPNGNHVAVMSMMLNENSNNHFSDACWTMAKEEDELIKIYPDIDYFVRIDFDIEPNTLRVFLDTCEELTTPIIKNPRLDFKKYFNFIDTTKAFIGFTGSTGTAWQKHQISNWTFCPYKWVDTTKVLGVNNSSINYGDEDSLSCFPNPFQYSTNINYLISEPSYVSLKIFNYLGEEIITLKNEFLDKGFYNSYLESSLLDNGIYFAVLTTDKSSKTIKIINIK